MIFIGLLLISIIGGDQHESKDQTDNVQDRKVNINDPQGGSLVSRYHLSIVGPPPKPLLGRPTRCRNVVSTFSRAPKNIVFTKTSFFRRVEFDFFL